MIFVSKTARSIDCSTLSRTSEIPKSPMTTGTSPIPSVSSMMSKVNRDDAAISVSIPMQPRKRPKAAMSRAFTHRPAGQKGEDRSRPRIIREKYSGGPNFRAISASGGATSIRPRTPIVPAIKEPKAAIPRAGAGPALAGHLVAVQAGDHRGGLPGDVHQDGGGGAAVHGPVIDPGEHDDGGNRGHMKGGGQEQGDGGHRPEPGQDAHQGPDRTPMKQKRRLFRAAGQPEKPMTMLWKKSILFF